MAPFYARLMRKEAAMDKYLYEAVMTQNEVGGFDVRFPELGIVTQGDSLGDAAFMAQDLLATWISAELATGAMVPNVGSFGQECAAESFLMGIATFAGPTTMPVGTMTVQEAADVLDVSTSRIHAMIRSGILGTEKVGTARLVSAVDVMNYFNSPRNAGRPRKAAAL